ncbi:hypothetical protein JW911_03425 [Candidatus Peregrinibacteria bacterium]|nr:hypothetical protein [Candidatus Peregrinibacteria bacterium]
MQTQNSSHTPEEALQPELITSGKKITGKREQAVDALRKGRFNEVTDAVNTNQLAVPDANAAVSEIAHEKYGMPKNGNYKPAALEKACTTHLETGLDKYNSEYNPFTGCKEMLDDISDAIDEALKLAEQHRMTKLKTSFSIPFYTPIQAILQGKKLEKKLKKIEKLYTKLPDNIRDRRLAKFLQNDRVSPHRGQKAALTADVTGITTVGLAGGALLASGGAAVVPLAIGGIVSGAVSIVSGMVAWHRNLTGVADTDTAIRKLSEMSAQVNGYRNQLSPYARPGSMPAISTSTHLAGL